MEFLGMAKKKRSPMELLADHDPIKKMEKTLEERKKTQQSHLERYNDALKEI
jgi:hypothetical protein